MGENVTARGEEELSGHLLLRGTHLINHKQHFLNTYLEGSHYHYE